MVRRSSGCGGAAGMSPSPGAAHRLERGGHVDPATLNRGGNSRPPREAAVHRYQRPGWRSWRRAETSLQGQGQGRARECAVEQQGQPLAVLLTEPREQEAALRLLKQARRRQGLPATRPLAGREAQEAARTSANEEPGPPSLLRQGQ
jgi:transposase-like protein